MRTRGLVAFWSDFDCRHRRRLYIHNEDRAYLDEKRYWERKQHRLALESHNLASFLQSRRFRDPDDADFHFSLLPVPFIGDLRHADIFILLLNPGVDPADYYAEYKQPTFRRALVRNLKQELRGAQYPFFCLDPQFCWSSGYAWWEGKLKKVVQALAKKKCRGQYRTALRAVSRRIAAIELVPYHSDHFDGGATEKNLPSARWAQQWVEKFLAPRARRGEILIVVTRSIKDWRLSEVAGRIVCYERGETRGASLTPRSRGGKAILRRLLKPAA